jgi:Flp pilus assembly protein TadG
MRLLHKKSTSSNRRGTVIAETAVALPVFFLMLFAFIEFGHVFMTIHNLNAAARRAARLGVSDGATTADVEANAQEIVSKAINVNNATIIVKDASIFDTANVDASAINYSQLSDIELSEADRRQLFLVRVSVNYADIGIMGPRWLGDLQIYGQAVMRRE